MVVVPSGRVTKEGKPIFEAAPTETDVQREISEQRVQTFGPGGRKISDTQRVKVRVGGEDKFVTPERALAISREGSREAKEAKTKIKRREQLEQTIKTRLEKEVREAKSEVERRKEGLKLREAEPETLEEERPKRAVELFSPVARKRLGLTETPEGLLEIRRGERKIIAERGEIRAELPVTAEFRTGFERQLGTGKPKLIGLKTRDGVLPFTTIKEIFEEKEKKARSISRKLVPISTFEIQKALAKVKLEELEGEPGVIPKARRAVLKAKVISLTVPERLFKQVREQPLQTGLIFGLSAVGAPLLAKIGKIPLATKILGGVFVASVGVEAEIERRRGGLEAAVGITTERIFEAGLFIGGTQLGTRISQIGKPTKVKILKPKGLAAQFVETLEVTGKEIKGMRKLGFETEVVTRVARTKVKPFRRRIVTPKDTAKLKQLLGRKDIDIVFGLEPTPPGKKISLPTLIQSVPAKTRVFKFEPEPFKIMVEGKLGVKVGEFTLIKDVKGIERIVDPTEFKITKGLGEFRKPITVLKQTKLVKEKLPFKLKAALGGRARITEIVKLKQSFSNIFGVGLQVPISVQTTTTTIIGKPPILAVTPLFEPAPLLLFAPSQILGLGRGIKRREVLDVRKDLGRALERRTIQEQRAVKDIKQISDIIQEQLPIQEPIIDVRRIQERDVISDVMKISQLKTIEETKPRPKEPRIKIPKVPPPPLGLLFPFPRLFLGEPIKRKRRPLRPEFGFTPGFMSAVLGEFGPPPKPGQMFTGQERRFIIKGKPFLTPLPKRREGIIQLVARQLGG